MILDPSLMAFLVRLSNGFNNSVDYRGLEHYNLQVNVTVTSDGEHLATLYEEGWDFREPED